MKKANYYILLFWVPVAIGLSSCARSAEGDMETAVQTHRDARNESEGRESCEIVFKNALVYYKPDELCAALLKRSNAELSLCENQIANSQYRNVIAKCKTDLDKKLKEVQEERNVGLVSEEEKIQSQTQNFRLPFQVQYRDLSQGYKAVTGDTQSKQVILTFDDGPSVNNTIKIVKALDQAGVKAHFFQLGNQVTASPEITKLVAKSGHSLGSHSWDHPDFKTIGFNQQVNQMQRTFQAIKNTIGWVDPFFRFPYGSTTAAMNQYLNQNRIGNFLWSVDSEDWRKLNKNGSLRTNAQVIRESMAQLNSRGRGLVLFHDSQARTAELLPEFLRQLYLNNYTVVLLKPKSN